MSANVNFEPGRVDPNVAVARIGVDGQVCFVNSFHGSVHLVADHLGTIAGSSYTPASVSGAAVRKVDTRPPPAPPVQTFQPGQYLVGAQIPAGRYVMNAGVGCYWERQSGLGGTLDEILANDFRGYAGRAIVDLVPGDVGFEFDGDCGALTTYVPSNLLSTTIIPGTHVVGDHIVPGTYVANVSDGCYWERLTGFSGDFDELIANDFISSSSQQFVTIGLSDVGFTSDAECGSWTRI